MAAIIRRHWRFAVLNALLVAIAIGVGVRYLLKPVAQAVMTEGAGTPETPANAVDPLTYSRVVQLRETLALTSQDLAAMGCTEEQAVAVLTSLKTWCEQNAAQWETAEQSHLSANRNLAEAVRRINVGPRDETILASVPTLKQSESSARQQMEEFFAGGGAVVQASFSSAQQQVWNIAKANRTAPAALRYVAGLTEQQKSAFVIAAARGKTINAVPELAGQAAALEVVRQAINNNLPGVAAAEEEILPMPDDLRGGATPVSGTVTP